MDDIPSSSFVSIKSCISPLRFSNLVALTSILDSQSAFSIGSISLKTAALSLYLLNPQVSSMIN